MIDKNEFLTKSYLIDFVFGETNCPWKSHISDDDRFFIWSMKSKMIWEVFDSCHVDE